jgi:FtsP/CotA-like multicopper oxidase with cupredoxin domain
MTAIRRSLLAVLAGALAAGSAGAQTPSCPPRPNPGTVVTNPTELTSQNGVLTADYTFRSSFDNLGYLHECYIYQTGQGPVEAPTLLLNPGDRLDLKLTDRLTYLPPPPPVAPKAAKSTAGMAGMAGMAGRTTPGDPCSGGTMVATSTNIHFHGLNIPPICHQDEILMTDIENTDGPFEYNFEIPKNDAPGLYWYHPHLHGVVTLQVNGGAPGALIIGGIEKIKPQVGGMPERVFMIRQQFTNPNSWLPGPNQLTINYQPAIAPFSPSPIIKMKPGAKEFWRVVNATSQGFLALQVWFGSTPQKLEVIELDGIPVKETTEATTIQIPPAGRAEFIMQGPPTGQTASFQQIGFNSGPIGNPNPQQELAVIETGADAQEPPALPAAPAAPSTTPLRFAGLDTATVTAKRKIYFAEATNGSNGPTEFFITVDGQKPKVFSMSGPPQITTTVGAVEDWTVENRTGETHAFHIHQIHFLFLEVNGTPFSTPELRDTVIVPAWSGTGPYSSVKMRMDFREPQIAGKFVYHCHVLDHEDAGMMAIIQVNPK